MRPTCAFVFPDLTSSDGGPRENGMQQTCPPRRGRRTSNGSSSGVRLRAGEGSRDGAEGMVGPNSGAMQGNEIDCTKGGILSPAHRDRQVHVDSRAPLVLIILRQRIFHDFQSQCAEQVVAEFLALKIAAAPTYTLVFQYRGSLMFSTIVAQHGPRKRGESGFQNEGAQNLRPCLFRNTSDKDSFHSL